MRALPRFQRRGRALSISFGASAFLALGIVGAGFADGILGTDGVRYGSKDPSADARGSLVSSTVRRASPDVQRLRYRFGPIHVQPGQNLNELVGDDIPGPDRPGFITRFNFNLVNLDGTTPSVTDVHFHHGVWGAKGVFSSVLFLVGEEKSIATLPIGYGWPVKRGDTWFLNHMIHNLGAGVRDVELVWDIDFIPAESAAGRTMTPANTLLMDVERGKNYPVFNAHRGDGPTDRFVYPDGRPHAYGNDKFKRNEYRFMSDAVLVAGIGHVHPGGLWTDLTLKRGGRSVNVFRSNAHYFDRRGSVSWDMAMEATPPDWRVAVKRGDVLSISATYDTRDASWYEAMGIDGLAVAQSSDGVDPFSGKLNTKGQLTHGRLPENIDPVVQPNVYPDPRTLAVARPSARSTVQIDAFKYAIGDLSATGGAGRPPTITAGGALTFVNSDAKRGIFHTVTSCKLPCNGSSGIGSPLADDGDARFDSGELGFGPPGWTAAANRDTWTAPRNLRPGTYSYFCRIHPFMRGSFRVASRAGRPTVKTAAGARRRVETHRPSLSNARRA